MITFVDVRFRSPLDSKKINLSFGLLKITFKILNEAQMMWVKNFHPTSRNCLVNLTGISSNGKSRHRIYEYSYNKRVLPNI